MEAHTIYVAIYCFSSADIVILYISGLSEELAFTSHLQDRVVVDASWLSSKGMSSSPSLAATRLRLSDSDL